MTQNTIFLFIFISLLSHISCKKTDNILLEENFNNQDKTINAQKLLSHPFISLAENESFDGSHAIRVVYKGYEMGSKRVVVQLPLQDKVTQATLIFDVKFDKDFQFVRGGKLHGVGPFKRITGGLKRLPSGWSARIMWRPEGSCASYLYDQDVSKKWGNGKRTDQPIFKKGVWQHIAMQVQLNDAGKTNGFSKIYIDNELIIDHQQVEFRGIEGEETLIQKFLFSTFHGGNTPDWAPVDEDGNFISNYALFDNFKVVKGLVTQ